jgi:hypothetical protein
MLGLGWFAEPAEQAALQNLNFSLLSCSGPCSAPGPFFASGRSARSRRSLRSSLRVGRFVAFCERCRDDGGWRMDDGRSQIMFPR